MLKLNPEELEKKKRMSYVHEVASWIGGYQPKRQHVLKCPLGSPHDLSCENLKRGYKKWACLG
jgi:hypothetical protein